MSAIEYGIEKGYIEKQPTENEREEKYFIFPKRILLEPMLHKILAEMSELGYDIAFNEREKIYVATNKTILSKEKEEAANNLDKVHSICEECKEPYKDVLNSVIGASLFISQESKIDLKETIGIFCSKIYNDAIKWVDEGGPERVKVIEVSGEELIEELDALIRSMK